ncbi:cysteine proteinase [Xylona heveae TC161]|uniref:Cysteine proteinase n=1 Tax=Xylona heveae (strain CBS 132557 / TC161) TaxID=1328760 RepID=A0A165I9W1_XYLHT|nr:cysteine proteinase [Xylona heveae TC161]KZF24600.1 cysteine proteinase [Xylona heveae TC161]
MAKRQAEESLENVDAAVASPASKKARVEDEIDESERAAPISAAPPSASINGSTDAKANGNVSAQSHRHSHGHVFNREQDERRGEDILAAADVEGEELEEAVGTDDEEDEGDALHGIDEDQSALTAPTRQIAPTEGYNDLYLDTINRAVLDFDFEKLCSISLSNINVYACLVCGKYFQGRGPKSHAYFHALDVGHHVYVNMETKKVYVLPEGYEVKNKSLDDIKFVVDPRLSREEVMKLDKEQKSAWDLSGRKYTPGFVGLNNIKANDYFNVIVHSLAHVSPLRNYFMLEDFTSRPQLVQRFSTLIRKIWNPRAFKSHVSPHELLQEISLRSNKRFTLTEQADPVDFISWFLNNLHLALGGSKTKPGTSIVQKVFQGKLKVESQQITARGDAGDRLRFEDATVHSDISRFLMLTLDLPAAPLFQDEVEKNIIPQVPLTSLLTKYDGIRSQEHLNMRKRYRLLHPLPQHLLFHIKRFSKNKFVSERNPTIVTFSPRSLDMSPYVEPNPALHPPAEPIWYDLVANVTHEAIRRRDDSVEVEADAKVWRVQLRDKSRDEWVEVQDLFVDRVSAETLFTKESVLQVWEKRKTAPPSKR